MSIIYLYVKQHSVTGLKYFGQTKSRDPFKYKGSGSYWTRHIKKHGTNHIKTLEVWGFDDREMCQNFAAKFSKEHNIVESKDWANLIPETGLADGMGRPGIYNGMYGRKHTKESLKKMAENRKNKTKGKTYEEMYGVEKAKEMKLARSKKMRENRLSGITTPYKTKHQL